MTVEALVGEDDPWTSDGPRVARLFRGATPEQRKAVLGVLAPDGGRESRGRRVALIGLRGAGKSTLGRRIADAFDAPFVELNEEIESESGMRIADLIALYGQEGYRRLEAQALDRVCEAHDNLVLAAAGGIVSAADTYAKLLARFHTIWLKASPDEHMNRVRTQGDFRPMAGNPAAMERLKSILTSRAGLYAQACYAVDTSGRTEDESAADLVELVASSGLLEQN